MGMKSMAAGMTLGAAAGAVTVLMMKRTNPARKLAAKAADKVETAVYKTGCKISNALDM